MFYESTKIKQCSCKHQFKTKYPTGSKTPIEICVICNHRKKTLIQNEPITKYFDPASEQTDFPYFPVDRNVVSKQEKYEGKMTIQKYVEYGQLYTNWMYVTYDGWTLPATKQPHDWCGEWKSRGCLNTNNHEKFGRGKTCYAQQYQSSCYRPSCTMCYYQWIIRQSNRATRRVKEYQKQSGLEPFHLMMSVSVADRSLTYEELKKKLNVIKKELGVIGGAVIFHPLCPKRSNRQQYEYRPHFHLICFGDIEGKVGLVGKKYGWYIKYMGKRKSIFQTFCYLLSHAGIKKGYRSMVWVGDLSYGKVPTLEKEPPTNICPCCKVKLVPIHYVGEISPIPPGQYFEGFIDPGGWYEVKIGEAPTGSYEYAPIAYVNEILKSISTA